ncbi:hypothetical protein AVEN_270321-1 [Araneus ventricosus]|uniref:Uncharacterized protein n=1 Tax=Araneus ventricosus TaxID=182803 RepID=A0A4Y2VHR0_ARAVE|nr:hypothetical protein AVEN_270321-1 [Araneus ventricosus]
MHYRKRILKEMNSAIEKKMKQFKKTSIFEKQLQDFIKHGNLMQLLKQSVIALKEEASVIRQMTVIPTMMILTDLKEKWKTVEGNGRITDDGCNSLRHFRSGRRTVNCFISYR